MFVGLGASRVRDLFEQGKAHAPCIIFIDEIDAVGRHRGAGLGGGHDEGEQTLNQLRVEMDGFESYDGVILLAATNRPDILDPALLRPGRFDGQIVVDMPDVKGREQILRMHTRKIPLGSNVNLERIAKGTPGLSGAELSNVVNEAALLAARRNKAVVDMDDLEDAKDKVMLGLERKSMVLTEEERKLTAYHESGHALVGLTVPGIDPIHKVTIVPRGRALGITFFLPEKDRRNVTKQWLLGQLAMSYGGRVAEELVFGPDKVTTGAYSDIQQATEMARRMVTQFGMSDAIGPIAVGDREAEIFLGREVVQRREVSEHTAELVDTELKRLLGEAYERARGILTQHRDRLDRLAAALLERETLVHWGAKAGADVLTGEGWALVGVAASRLAPLGRPDRAPSGLARLVPELARFLASYVEPPGAWAIAGATLPLAHPVLIGIVNVTPDSFSDGGRFTTLDRAVAQAERLIAEGATLLDVGGESTRPGAAPVPVEGGVRRVAPVVEQLARRGLGSVSVDTRKADVARAAIAAGAAVVNDVSGLAFDPELVRVAARAGVGVILMHMRGTPDTMDGLATYRQVAAEVAAELAASAERAVEAGVERQRLVLDPGF